MRRIALALCVTAVVVPAAQAASRPDDRAVGPRTQATQQQSTRPDDRAGIRSVDIQAPAVSTDPSLIKRHNALAKLPDTSDVSSYYTPAAIKAMGDRYNAEAALFAPLPAHVQDLEALNESYQQQPGSAVRPDDRAGIRGVEQQLQTVYVTQSRGFDWRDAGIGALGAFGACLLAGLALLAMRKDRTVVVA